MCEEHRAVTDNSVRQKKHPVHAGNVRYVKKASKKTIAQIKMYYFLWHLSSVLRKKVGDFIKEGSASRIDNWIKDSERLYNENGGQHQ